MTDFRDCRVGVTDTKASVYEVQGSIPDLTMFLDFFRYEWDGSEVVRLTSIDSSPIMLDI